MEKGLEIKRIINLIKLGMYDTFVYQFDYDKLGGPDQSDLPGTRPLDCIQRLAKSVVGAR